MPQTPGVTVDLRPYCEGDLGVVSLAWKHLYLDSPPLSALVSRGSDAEAWAWANQYVDAAISGADIVVACNPEGEDHVWGFIAFTGEAAEALYVKPLYRRLGVGRALWHHAGLDAHPIVRCRAWSSWAERVAARYRLVHAPRNRYGVGEA
jgi:GNAT superfamily N-acetyltransferase